MSRKKTEDAADSHDHDLAPVEDETGPAGDGAAEEAVADADSSEEGLAVEEDRAAEIADLKDRLLRAMAETENVRARAERTQQDTARYAVSTLARDLLSVADNLRRALESVPDEVRENESFATVIAGIELTERELAQAFEKHRIRRIDPRGEKFDHNFHQAMFEVEASDQPPGTVVEVMQCGYAIHDRLLRPAMVGVAKGPKGEATPGDGVDTVA